MEIMLMTSSSLPRQHVMELPSLPYYSVTQRNFLQPFSAIFQQIFVEDLMLYLHTAEFGARAKFYTIKGLSAVIEDYAKDGGEELFTKMHCIRITNP